MADEDRAQQLLDLAAAVGRQIATDVRISEVAQGEGNDGERRTGP